MKNPLTPGGIEPATFRFVTQHLNHCARTKEGIKIRFPDFVTTAQDGGKVVSLTHRPTLPPGNTTGTHFC